LNSTMCSRFELNSEPRDLLKIFGISNLPGKFRLQEFYPSNNVLCFNNSGAYMHRWGLEVSWSKNILFNARAETLLKKHTFGPFLKSRCLVPATAYFEWRHVGAHRIRNKIFLKNRKMFGFAGVINGANLIILTRESPPSIAHIHGRMPMIVPEKAQIQWGNNSYPIRESLDLIDVESEALITEEDEHHLGYQRSLFSS